MDSIYDWWNVSWNQAVFGVKTGGFWLLFRRFLSRNQASFYRLSIWKILYLMLYDITSKGDFFFSGKNKKDNKSLHFRFLFLFLLKKKFDLFTAILQQGCISLHSLSLKGYKLITYWIYGTYIITSANLGSFLHCLWWQGDKLVCKLFIYT